MGAQLNQILSADGADTCIANFSAAADFKEFENNIYDLYEEEEGGEDYEA